MKIQGIEFYQRRGHRTRRQKCTERKETTPAKETNSSLLNRLRASMRSTEIDGRREAIIRIVE